MLHTWLSRAFRRSEDIVVARKYDVAFSFLTVDLPLALRLADALTPLCSFVYAREQDQIILRDGMDVFSAAFGEESRLNVVLYRTGYGEQGWTNFEREIVKGRCLGKEGWDSFALIRTDNSTVPGWIPPAYIYGDATSMEIDTLAAVIRLRAKMAGADVATESASSRMARLADRRQFDRETEGLSTGAEAFASIARNIEVLYERISAVITEHARRGSGLTGSSGRQNTNFGANLDGVGCYIHYENHYGQVTHGKLMIRFFDGQIAIPGTRQMIFGEPRETGRLESTVIRSRALGWCWLFRGYPRTSEEVADFVLDELIRQNR
jgi:hypothetical protein